MTILSALVPSLKPLTIIMMGLKLFISSQFPDIFAVLHQSIEFYCKPLCLSLKVHGTCKTLLSKVSHISDQV